MRPHPTLLIALVALVACSTTVSGPGTGRPDVQADARPVIPRADAGPQFDATPSVKACVEGDRQLSDPGTGVCYMMFNAALSWQAAQAECLGLGANLVIINDVAEQTLVGGFASGFPAAQPDLWIGASDTQAEGTFVWIDATAIGYSKWRLGEPNNGAGGGTENCAIIEGDNPAREWDDRPCGPVLPYICER